MINYDHASKTYDNTRQVALELIDLFDQTVRFSIETLVLDFGCGTGNYLDTIQKRFGSKCFGVEPSDGMRSRAKEKNPQLIIESGDHSHIPFSDSFFDFVFMTDVIHHVPDLSTLFEAIGDALKPSGKLCIVTQSHKQIESRFFNVYFPSLADIEKRRYPDIPVIIRAAKSKRLTVWEIQIRPYAKTAKVTADLVRTVEEKHFSMFRLISDEEYLAGLSAIRSAVGAQHDTPNAGDSLIWITKTA